jgi:SAM-dependent methyltransferase
MKSALSELWIIVRFGLLKLLAMCLHAFFGQSQTVERWIIAAGNRLFAQQFPLRLFDGYDSYAEQFTSDFGHFTALLPPRQWLRDRIILDLGSGLGQYSKRLAEHGARRVVSLEYQSDKAAWHAWRNWNASAVCGSAEELPFASTTFDTVFSHTVFEHIADVRSALSEVRRVLKPGGQAIISVNFFHHRGGHHLFPYIHFPWPTWIVGERALCTYWTGRLIADHARGKMGFFAKGTYLASLTDGAEIHLNKLTFDEFEALVEQTDLKIARRHSSETLGQLFPLLTILPRLKYFVTGTVYYVLVPKISAEITMPTQTRFAA